MNSSTTILGKPPSSPPPSGSARRPQLDGTFSDAAPLHLAADAAEINASPSRCDCDFECDWCSDTQEYTPCHR